MVLNSLTNLDIIPYYLTQNGIYNMSYLTHDATHGPPFNPPAKDCKNTLNEADRKINVKGITLKQYFRLCENQKLNEIKEESVQSSKSSLLETPSFPNEGREKIKFKTEISDEHENIFHSNNMKFPAELQVTNRNTQAKPGEKGKQAKDNKEAKEQGKGEAKERRKVFTKIHSQSTKHQFQIFNRSTLNTFYQLQQNKKKMLKKIQADKEKVHDLSLKEALSITKYGSRFNIDHKL